MKVFAADGPKAATIDAICAAAKLNKRIGQRIRQERLRRNLTLQQVADRAWMTPSQLSQVELGKNAASIAALVRIAKALKLHVSELLSDV